MEYTIERLKKCMPLTEGTYEEIDKDMIPILTELNEKGYRTIYCCQGHVKDGAYITYLTFERQCVFSKPIPVYHIGADKKNKHTKISKSKLFGGDVYHWFGSKNKTDEELELERKELIEKLTEWAKTIEPRKNNLITKYYLWGINGSRTKNLGRMITEEEKNKIINKNEYKKYEELPVTTDGNKFKGGYELIA